MTADATSSTYRSTGTSDLHVGSLFGLEGKVAVVTGGSRGIGFMIAAGLVTNGVTTFITARKAEACDAAAAELDALSDTASCVSIPADLSDPDGLASFVSTLREHTDTVDVLVNNAGAAWGAPLGEFPEIGFDKVMNLNVKAPFMLTQELLPELENGATADDPARVVMIGSIDGIRVPVGDNYSYSAAKAGVHMLARHLGAHVVDRHITVNSIAPGPFESKMMEYRLEDDDSRAEVIGHVPRRRIGSAEDIAGTVIFLASRAGAFTTGATIPVDGGISTIRMG
ncbi:SDR family oxidoreductase [Ilumatobacter nonamiensis]|uniref:SDR family oxidoreductase n=1 Tax=Ilumatobacter nonamiensis TaxID=467093 RepID=UPI000348756E|nr:SDR family oxidoreductase [Ilumatobacter nonamiensis]